MILRRLQSYGRATLEQCTSGSTQVVLEMIELRETDTARAMLRQTNVFQRMRQDDPDRLLRLERLCNQTYFDIRYCDCPLGRGDCTSA